MPAKDAPLRLVKGGVPSRGGPGLPGPGQRIRRTVTRRTPRPLDPVTEVLGSLDREPVSDTPDREPVSETPDRRPASDTPDREPVGESADLEPVDETAARQPVGEAPAPARSPLDSARRQRRMTVAAVSAVLVVVLAMAGFAGSRWYADRTLDAAHQQALAAAKQTTVNFVSVSASTVDRDLQRVVAASTGDFHAEFTRGQAQVRQAIVANNVDSQGTVLRAALLSGSRRTAVVLIAMDATVRNTNAPNGRVSRYRIQVEVAKDAKSGRWLVSRLQFVG